MSSPSPPLLFEPSPWRPRSALYSGLKRKCTSVLCRSLDSMTTSPPLPPSPPEGPPRGTYFSLRNAMQPFPPSPPFTEILASSTNMRHPYREGTRIKHTPRRKRKTKVGDAPAVRHANQFFSSRQALQPSSQ